MLGKFLNPCYTHKQTGRMTHIYDNKISTTKSLEVISGPNSLKPNLGENVQNLWIKRNKLNCNSCNIRDNYSA